MSWTPNMQQASWRKMITIGMIDWMEHELHCSPDDVVEVTVAKDAGSSRFYGMTYICAFRLQDDRRFQIPFDTLHYLIAETLIDGYADIYSPNVWIDRLIMGRRAPLADDLSADVPNYARPEEATRVLLKIAHRPDDDRFLFSFAFRLLDKEHLKTEEIIPVFRMLCLTPDHWTPKQICSAAYQAYCYEVSMRGSVPQVANA